MRLEKRGNLYVHRLDDGTTELLPSVGYVLSLAFPSQYSSPDQSAIERGRQVHAACEEYDLYGGVVGDYPEEILRWAAGYRHVRDDLGVQGWDVIETPLAIPHQYAGTLDRYAQISRLGAIVADIKTSRSRSKAMAEQRYLAQLGAYCRLAWEHGWQVDAAVLIVLDGEVRYKVFSALEAALAWDRCWDIYLGTIFERQATPKEAP